MKNVLHNTYIATLLRYLLGVIGAFCLFLLPLLIAYLLHGGHKQAGEGAFWGGLFAELIGFGALIIGVLVLPPLTVYYLGKRSGERENGRTAIYCAFLSPALLIGFSIFFIPIVARYLALLHGSQSPPNNVQIPPDPINEQFVQ